MKTGIVAGLMLVLLMPWSAHAQPEKVVAFGDSITKGRGDQSWPRGIGARRVANAGAGLVGARAGHRPAIETYRSTVLAQRPDVVIVAYGINDLGWSSTRDIMMALRQIKHWNKVRGVETWIATLTPLGADPWNLNPQRVELNERIRSSFYRVIDFEAALAGPQGRLPKRYDSGDGLHPNALAYKKMAKAASVVYAASYSPANSM